MLRQQSQGHCPAHPFQCAQSGGPPIFISQSECAVMRSERPCDDRREKQDQLKHFQHGPNHTQSRRYIISAFAVSWGGTEMW